MTGNLSPNYSPPKKPNKLKQNIIAASIFAVVVIGSIAIVQVFKKPGQMTVIEAQSMDMTTMAPPKGAVPVGIARVENEYIEGFVTYTGTVQAYEDEDIYPRITGRIVEMPVYPGDRVRKGQLLVRLDPPENSEYWAKLEETRFASKAASHTAGADKEMFIEKKYQLKAAQSAEAATRKVLKQAKASLDYWIPEIKRQQSLLNTQVISQEEFDRDKSQHDNALAKVEEAEEKLTEAINTALAAQAAFDGQMHHVGHGEAALRQTEAAQQAARVVRDYTKIVASDDGIVTKRAISPGVVVSPGMLILKVAHIRKVRLQAEVAAADATRIRIGNSVFVKDSQDSDEQLEAKVTSVFPAADPTTRTFIVEALVNNVGSNDQNHHSSSSVISSISEFRFLPGQYVVMRTSTGGKTGLTIPASAVIWREGRPQVWKATSHSGNGAVTYSCPMHPEVVSDKPGKCPKCGMDLQPNQLGASNAGPTKYTCLMHPEVVSDKPGKCPKCNMNLEPQERAGPRVAQLVDIKVGISNSERSQVLEGLAEGDEVIFAGYTDLHVGTPVLATEWGKAGPGKLPKASDMAGNRLQASNNWLVNRSLTDLELEISMSPVPPKSGANTLIIKLQQKGRALSGATVTAKTSMPSMNMAGPDLKATATAADSYEMKADFMSGLWLINLSIGVPGKTQQQMTVDLEVP